jgi:hypothetical protein
VAKKSLKNSKHLVELIGAATLPAIALLSKVDKLAFISGRSAWRLMGWVICCNKPLRLGWTGPPCRAGRR